MTAADIQPDITLEGPELEAIINPYARAVEAYLSEWLQDRLPELPRNLYDAVEYALLGGGKRLRPALVMLSCAAVNKSGKYGGRDSGGALAVAGAIEMIHAFSLIHDDLPAMDDDDLRRGRPTLHKEYGEAMAILAGDMLMSLAVEMITGTIRGELPGGIRWDVPGAALSADIKVWILDELFHGGCAGMIAGQAMDTAGTGIMEGTDKLSAEERLEEIHRLKTGALIVAACRCGGIVGGANAEQLSALTGYAAAAGLMFQCVDDLLDETQTGEQLGKQVGKDRERGKLTAPLVYGIEGTRNRIKELRDASLAALELLGEKADSLRDLARAMANRTR